MKNILLITTISFFAFYSTNKDELVEDLCIDPKAEMEYKESVMQWTDMEEATGTIMSLAPVCGCNSKTYPNDHYAQLEGVVSWTEGSCK